MSETIDKRVANGVATITLDRPERRNAITAEMQEAYFAALREADADPEVRAVVVTGAGPAFCGGVDFAALGEMTADEDPSAEQAPTYLPLTLSLPVIGAINGPAIGLGFIYAVFTDVRFAAASASFSTPYARLGLIAEHGMSWLLPRLVGAGAAADLLLSGRTVAAEEALAIGLVQRVVPDDELLPAATAYAEEIAASCSPRSLSIIRRQLQTDAEGDFVAAFDRSLTEIANSFKSPDVAAAMTALRDRRPPQFPPLTHDRD